jgi:Tol biopolymer transport system component
MGFGSPSQRPFAISPDGARVAFMTQDYKRGGGIDLWIQPLSGEPRKVPGTQSARAPFWSADSQSVGFFADGRIKRIGVAGGAAETICESVNDFGASWGPDGTILFANSNGVYRVPASGGTPQRVFAAQPGTLHFDPVLLPDGRHYLLSAFDDSRIGSIIAVSLDGGPERLVLRDATNATWIGSGHLLFVRGEALLAQKFDPRRMEVSGQPVVIADPIGVMRRETMNALYSASRDGRVIALQPTLSFTMRLVEVNREGDVVAELAGPGRIWYPAISRDGTRVACMIEQPNGDADIWTIDRGRGVMMRITTEPSHDSVPIWSPDGKWIAYSSDFDLYRIPAAGGTRELLLKGDDQIYANDWTADGQSILFTVNDARGTSDIKTLRLSDRKVTPVVTTEFRDQWARFSPDGRWIAYQSLESGTSEVYVQRYPDGAFKTRVSNKGGSQPEWSGDGRKIYYKPFYEADVVLGEGVQVSTPRPMLRRTSSIVPFAAAVLPDGSGVIARQAVDDIPRQGIRIDVLLNADLDAHR